MIAVSDSGPIHYLVLIDRIDALPNLFDRVFVPEAVYDELRRDRTPRAVYRWIGDPPEWLEIVSIEVSAPEKRLGRGEWEAIHLADSRGDETKLLMDDYDGRVYAERRGLAVVGTLGILARAYEHNRSDLRESIERLLRTNFRADPRLIQSLLEEG